MQKYISDMSGLFLKSLRRSIEGNNGTPSMKALDLFAKIEGLVDSANKVDVNIGAGGRSNDDLENELAELEKQLEAMEDARSEEHTSELQSRGHLVCRLLLEKKNTDLEHENNTP